MQGNVAWTMWNMILAALPVVFGYALAHLGRQLLQRRQSAQGCKTLGAWCGVFALFSLWLAFLPNSCYLLTQWRHFLNTVDRQNLWVQTTTDKAMMFPICALATFYLIYSGFGVLSLTFAIRPVEQALRRLRIPFFALAPALFLALSLGVYLGLILRFNSWDLWVRPGVVWHSVAAIPESMRVMTAIVGFGALLWGLYEAVDLWTDGCYRRLTKIQRQRFGHINRSAPTPV